MAKKGTTNNPNGRPKGSQNKATKEFKEALNKLINHATPNMIEWLDKIAKESPEKAFDIIAKLAEYVHPKLARTELTGDTTQKIIIEHSIANSPNTKGKE